MMHRAHPDTLDLVRRCEAYASVTLAEHDGRLIASPAGRLTDELRLRLAESKHAVLGYLAERSPLHEVLDKLSREEEREELREHFIERVDERVVCQGNSEAEAVRIAWDELGRILESRLERARERCGVIEHEGG